MIVSIIEKMPCYIMCSKGQNDEKLSYKEIEEIVGFVNSKTTIRPKIGIICGSGLGGLAEDLDVDLPTDVISYKDVPGFPKTTGIVT